MDGLRRCAEGAEKLAEWANKGNPAASAARFSRKRRREDSRALFFRNTRLVERIDRDTRNSHSLNLPPEIRAYAPTAGSVQH